MGDSSDVLGPDCLLQRQADAMLEFRLAGWI